MNYVTNFEVANGFSLITKFFDVCEVLDLAKFELGIYASSHSSDIRGLKDICKSQLGIIKK
jgi:hypothetical protein